MLSSFRLMPSAPGGAGTPPASAGRGASSPPPPYLPSRQPPSVPRGGEPNRRERNGTEPSPAAAVAAPRCAAHPAPLPFPAPLPLPPVSRSASYRAVQAARGGAARPFHGRGRPEARLYPSCFLRCLLSFLSCLFLLSLLPFPLSFSPSPLPLPFFFFLSPCPSAAAPAVGGAGTQRCACGRARCSRKQTRGLPVPSPAGQGWQGLVTWRFAKLRAPERARSPPASLVWRPRPGRRFLRTAGRRSRNAGTGLPAGSACSHRPQLHPCAVPASSE